MYYSKEDEKENLLLKYESKGNLEDINQVINFFVDNFDSILKLIQNTHLYKHLNKILQKTVQKNENNFKEMCSVIAKYESQSETVLLIIQSLINIRSLLDGKIGIVLPNLKSLDKDKNEFMNLVASIVCDQYNSIQTTLRNEEFVKIWRQKRAQDKKAMKEGKHLELEEQEGYKFFFNIKNSKP